MMFVLANQIGIWTHAANAGITLVVLGFFFAIVLLIASEKLKVQRDVRIEKVLAALPGANCGACGFAGCQNYAEAVVANPILLGKCAPGGLATLEKIAQTLNLQISESGPPQRPVVFCRARTADKIFCAKYEGIPTCLSANALPNAQACKFGCLGFSDCTRACRFDSIHIIDGLATVNYDRCTGCGACARACPRNIIKMVPFSYENMMTVACSNKETGKVTRSMCSVGCIACGLCTKQSDLFIIKDNLAQINFEAYQPSAQAEVAMNKCPTGVIVYRGKTAPPPRPPAEKTIAAKA
jgi:Na+-translocating ferredoxin:NAD+ oxidoreductase RNF subunit RnfB